MLKIIKYSDQFQVGLTFAIHNHCYNEPKCFHFHMWIDLGKWCIEITIGKDHDVET